MKLKAIFPNTDGRLFSSQFVNARLRLDVEHGATVVPAVAIQRSPQGPFVYVVKPDQTVTVRPVTVGVADGDDVAITAGVTVAEPVVVDGADRLRNGVRVAVQFKANGVNRAPPPGAGPWAARAGPRVRRRARRRRAPGGAGTQLRPPPGDLVHASPRITPYTMCPIAGPIDRRDREGQGGGACCASGRS